MIGPLIFVHELGHYFAGRAFGVKADAFSIGFGREVIGWTDKRGTRWKVGWMPLGGYVKFAGDMNPASVPIPNGRRCPGGKGAHLPGQAAVAALHHRRGRAGDEFPVRHPRVRRLLLGLWRAAHADVVASVMRRRRGGEGRHPARRPRDDDRAAGHHRFKDIAPIVRIRPGEEVRMDIYRGERQIHLT